MFHRFLLCLLVVPLTVSAALWEDIDVWAAGEALLWRPVKPYSYFAILSDNVPNNILPTGAQIATTAAYHWGYRIEIGMRRCNNDVEISWASLNASETTFVAARPDQTIFPSLSYHFSAGGRFPGGAARANESINYDVLNGSLGHYSQVLSGCSTGRLFAGIRYMRIFSDLDVIYFDRRVAGNENDQFVKYNSDVQGIGPQVGYRLSYGLCWGLSFLGGLNGGLLVGSSKAFFASVDLDNGLIDSNQARVHNKSVPLIVPFVDISFGLGLCRSLSALSLFGAVEYQVVHYFEAHQQSQFFSPQNLSNNGTFKNSFSFDGWNFRIGASY